MTQMVERDETFLVENSMDSYTVVAPGGVVETREQVIGGFAAFAAVDLHFANSGCHQFSIALRTFHFVVILRFVSTRFCENQF